MSGDAQPNADSAHPVLLLTSHWEDDDIASGFLAGADAYVIKPANRKNLLRYVDDLLTA